MWSLRLCKCNAMSNVYGQECLSRKHKEKFYKLDSTLNHLRSWVQCIGIHFVSLCLPTKSASWRIRLSHNLRMVGAILFRAKFTSVQYWNGLLHFWWNTHTALPTMSHCLPFLLLPFFISNVRPSLKTSFSTSKLKKLQFLPPRIPKRVNQLNLSIFARLSPNRGRSCPLTGQKVGKSDTDNQSHWGSACPPVLHYSSPRRT